MAKVTCPYCAKTFDPVKPPSMVDILRPQQLGAEIKLARENGCALVTMERGATARDALYFADVAGKIKNIGLQVPERGGYVHKGPDLCEAMWISASWVKTFKEWAVGKNIKVWE